jgi:hypothetical protein
MRALAIAALSVLMVACSAATPVATGVGGAPTQAPGTDQPASSPPPPEGPKQFAVGETIEVTGDFISADLRVRVAEVKQATKYGTYSKPAAGNIYLATKYEYEAIEDGATYNSFDWQVFVDGTAVDKFTIVIDGPKPELSSGTLPKGRKAAGWVVYEVPIKGQVILSYGATMFGGSAPTFEVVARKS